MKNFFNFFPNLLIIIFFIAISSILLRSFIMIDKFTFSFSRVVIYFVIPATLAFFSLILFFLNKEKKINFSIIFISSTFAIFLGEIILSYYPIWKQKQWIKSQKLILKNFDQRSSLEVIKELRKSGKKIYPVTYSANSNTYIDIKGQKVLALSGVANEKTLFCNETGEWLSYNSDELGFRNPRDIWGQSDIDFLILGDSYAQGTCVNENNSISGIIRNYSSKTINLSYSMNGPLIQLAILREYGDILKPKNVLWFYYSNDLFDMYKNLKIPTLKSYIDKNYSQRLYQNKDLINFEMKKLSNKIVNDFYEGKITPRKLNFNLQNPNFSNILKLSALRSIIQLPNYYEGSIDVDFEMYKNIFYLAISELKKWDGNMIFVYLPSYNELANYKKSLFKKDYDLVREKIIPIIKESGVKFIDFTPIFHKSGRVDNFFHNPKTHYNEKGYKIVGDYILNELD